VRLVAAELDFSTGMVSNQRRMNFRYDAISDAQVAELGIRFDGGRRQIILLDEDDSYRSDKVESIILSQGFRLSFVNGRDINVVVENFDDGLIDRLREDPNRLFELSLDASGVAGALRVLEAIAAEGKEWIAQERARRGRRIVDFQKSLGVPPVLPEATSPATHQLPDTTNSDGGQTPPAGPVPTDGTDGNGMG
jgi:hypothetical protein